MSNIFLFHSTEVITMKFKSICLTFFISLLTMIFLFTFSSPLGAQYISSKKKATALAASMQPVQAAQPVQAKQPVQTMQPVQAIQPVQAAPVETAKPTKSLTSKKAADDWFDKGALCATYGNDRAAVRYFQKAISLDPQRSDAYFEQGISYGQLGEFDKALPLIDKAIEMEPQNALYLYGRGRVHLLAGEKEKAMEDIKKSAELDDEDAQTYMENIARVEEMKGED
jgi:tetratricopeptide (TPR) repeat protein